MTVHFVLEGWNPSHLSLDIYIYLSGWPLL